LSSAWLFPAFLPEQPAAIPQIIHPDSQPKKIVPQQSRLVKAFYSAGMKNQKKTKA